MFTFTLYMESMPNGKVIAKVDSLATVYVLRAHYMQIYGTRQDARVTVKKPKQRKEYHVCGLYSPEGKTIQEGGL